MGRENYQTVAIIAIGDTKTSTIIQTYHPPQHSILLIGFIRTAHDSAPEHIYTMMVLSLLRILQFCVLADIRYIDCSG